MTQHATGTFDVKIAPQKPDNPPAEASGLGRMSMDKQFHGDLEAASKGEMLSLLIATSAPAVTLQWSALPARCRAAPGALPSSTMPL